MWGFVQLSVSITAACMPALRPLFAFLSDAVTSRSRSRQPGGTSGQNARSGYLRQYDSSGSNLKGSGLRSFGGGEMGGDNVALGAYPRRGTYMIYDIDAFLLFAGAVSLQATQEQS
jgi:hypothetical protein